MRGAGRRILGMERIGIPSGFGSSGKWNLLYRPATERWKGPTAWAWALTWTWAVDGRDHSLEALGPLGAWGHWLGPRAQGYGQWAVGSGIFGQGWLGFCRQGTSASPPSAPPA